MGLNKQINQIIWLCHTNLFHLVSILDCVKMGVREKCVNCENESGWKCVIAKERVKPSRHCELGRCMWISEPNECNKYLPSIISVCYLGCCKTYAYILRVTDIYGYPIIYIRVQLVPPKKFPLDFFVWQVII